GLGIGRTGENGNDEQGSAHGLDGRRKTEGGALRVVVGGEDFLGRDDGGAGLADLDTGGVVRDDRRFEGRAAHREDGGEVGRYRVARTDDVEHLARRRGDALHAGGDTSARIPSRLPRNQGHPLLA